MKKEVAEALKQERRIVPCILSPLKWEEVKGWNLDGFEGVEFEDKYQLARGVYQRISKKIREVEEEPEYFRDGNARIEAPPQKEEHHKQIEVEEEPEYFRDSKKADSIPLNPAALYSGRTNNKYNDPTLPGYDPAKSIPLKMNPNYTDAIKNGEIAELAIADETILKTKPSYEMTAAVPIINSDVDILQKKKDTLPPKGTLGAIGGGTKLAIINKKEIDRNATELYDNGLVFNRLGNYREAIECFSKSLEFDPSKAKVWSSKGLVLYKLGNYREAIECYDRSLSLNPNEPSVLGNKDKAVNALKDPHDNETKSNTYKISNWDRLLHKNVRSVYNEDIGNIGGILGDHLSVNGNYNRTYNIPKSSVQSFSGSEVLVNISLRDMNYYDVTSESGRFIDENVDLYTLAKSIQEFLDENNFSTKLFDDSTSTESRFHIAVMKSGKLRLVMTMKRSADISLKGSPNDFVITISTGESVFGAMAKLNDFVRGGLEKSLWSYIKMKINILKTSGKK